MTIAQLIEKLSKLDQTFQIGSAEKYVRGFTDIDVYIEPIYAGENSDGKLELYLIS